MFFDRDENARRQRQMAYRNELRQQIELKNSKLIQKQERLSNNKAQTFSLLKNIEIQQQNRRKAQQNFYSDLQKQIQFQKQEKKRKKEQEARRQLEEDERIRKDNQMLRQRAEMEKMQQQKKIAPKNDPSANSKQTLQNKNKNSFKNYQQTPIINRKQNTNQSNLQKNNPTNDKNNNFRLKSSEIHRNDQNQLLLQSFQQPEDKKFQSSLSSMPTYVNRIQNQALNFLPQRKHMNSYFQQLLGEKRKFQQEAASISELNKLFFQQKIRAGKIQSRGLNQLKKLQHLLDEKGVHYMSSISNSKSIDQFDFSKKLILPNYENSRITINDTGWRKLD